MKYLRSLLFPLFLGLILFLSVRGVAGNPSAKQLNTRLWKEDGPFELSPERGRFALLYSIVENKSFFFSVDLARFTTPDLGYKNGHYVSLFAPAVSYITAIGYMIGKNFGLAQIGAFLIISLFGLFNALLISSISKKLGANPVAANIASLVYLFATPAFAYSVTLYQHQISTFLILSAFSLLISTPSFLKLFLIWFLCAASIPVDYPNLVLMAPVGISALGWIFSSEKLKDKIQINFNFVYLFTFLGLVLPLIFFFWFNFHSYGNPMQFSGTVGSVAEIDKDGNPTTSRIVNLEKLEDYSNPNKQKKSAVGFFDTRDLTNGFYIHLLSPDRGILYFTPVILFGLLGLVVAAKKKISSSKVLLAVIGADLLLYSMWGDPWGGWAFGSRYLVPAYAAISIFIGLFLTAYKKNILLLLSFIILAYYSILVNTAGALSTSANPPKVQVLELEKVSGMVQKYTYERNTDLLKAGQSKSFAYNTYFKKNLTSYQYYQILVGVIFSVLTLLTAVLFLNKQSHEN